VSGLDHGCVLKALSRITGENVCSKKMKLHSKSSFGIGCEAEYRTLIRKISVSHTLQVPTQ